MNHVAIDLGGKESQIEMRLAIPPELGPAAAVLAELQDRVHAVEAECAAER